MIWNTLGRTILRQRLPLLVMLGILTGIMAYFASQVQLSYEFSKAIPVNHPRYVEYQEFRQLFGDDGNVVVLGVQHPAFFERAHFDTYRQLMRELRAVTYVEDVLAVPGTVYLERDSVTEQLRSVPLFPDTLRHQEDLDRAADQFRQQLFYRSLLYQPDSSAYLMAIRVNKDALNSPRRVALIQGISDAADRYQSRTGVDVHLSGLPLIRTLIAGRIQKEMGLFLVASLLLSVFILFLFFRSVSTTLVSIAVVGVSVIWTIALIHICGYRITLLNALIPSLVVVIGIPNAIYFINKYHTGYLAGDPADPQRRKTDALVDMVGKMGVVTLFCNITAAIGFAVFALTHSAILKEFGVVSGISIMLIFLISLVMLPAILSYLPAPDSRQLKYLDNRWIGRFLARVETWVFGHRKTVILATVLLLVLSTTGILRLRSVAFMVDDLPKTDKIYTDLKFFERQFRGIMPLEILIDAKKRRGLRGLTPYYRIDSLSGYIVSFPEMNRPLSLAEGLKFATQAFNNNDSSQYRMPGDFEAVFLKDYLSSGTKADTGSQLTRLTRSFMDKEKRYARISVNMADVGTERLPVLLDSIQRRASQYFDSSYRVTLTGTTITFLEGSRFIINGLKESILWAFALIAVCMLYLFKSIRILICSLIPNLIPLFVTAGIMGWAGVPLKPSTVLVFSVALGIAVDITIRFLVNYRQILPHHGGQVQEAVRATVQQTGLSIIYTALVLTAGFIVFCASGFGGTFALGWLTSLTLLVATLTNLIVLPVLLLVFNKNIQKRHKQ